MHMCTFLYGGVFLYQMCMYMYTSSFQWVLLRGHEWCRGIWEVSRWHMHHIHSLFIVIVGGGREGGREKGGGRDGDGREGERREDREMERDGGRRREGITMWIHTLDVEVYDTAGVEMVQSLQYLLQVVETLVQMQGIWLVLWVHQHTGQAAIWGEGGGGGGYTHIHL